MIRINLLPGSTRRAARRMPRLGVPSVRPQFKGIDKVDRWAAFVVTAWIVGPLVIGWLFLGTRSRMNELEVAIEGARLDSARYAEMRAANAVLLARQDTIAQKLEIIQEIDAGRFAWVHIMDEVSRSLPQYTWLVGVNTQPSEAALQAPRFSIEGRTGTTFALTEFMQNLEASPFLKSITLVTTDQIREGENMIYSFTLDGQFQEPTPDVIETVPIFDRAEG
ncbi:MAG: PilN domain-containing protein [Longimicrobiales bacterium]